MSLADLYWREPLWMWCIFMPPFAMLINGWWQRRQLQSFADASLLPWLVVTNVRPNKRLTLYSLLMAWLFLCVSLAGPRFVKQLPAEFQFETSTLIVIVDLSASMNAADIRPNRIAVAQRLLKKWLFQKIDSLAVGVVLFSGHAFELMPATKDTGVITHFIDTLSEVHLPTAGNDLAAALKIAKTSLTKNKGHRRIVVLTDGDIELLEQQHVSKILNRDWNDSSIKTYLIGVGESKPVTVPDRVNGLIEHQNRPVLSRLEADWLKRLSTNSGNHYRHFRQAEGMALNDLIDLPVMRVPDDAQQLVIWQEWFPLPLLLGVLFLWVSIFSSKREDQVFE